MRLEIKFGNAKHPFAARKVVPQNSAPFCTMAFDVIDKDTGYLIREGSVDLNETATVITGVRVKTGNWEQIPNTEDFRRTNARISLAPKSGRIEVELDEHGNIVESEASKEAIADPVIAAVIAKAKSLATIEVYDGGTVTSDESAHNMDDPGSGKPVDQQAQPQPTDNSGGDFTATGTPTKTQTVGKEKKGK